MNKIRYTIDERLFRNDRGQLHLGYVTRLLNSEKIDQNMFLYKLSKATSIAEPKLLFVLHSMTEIMLKNLYNGSPVQVPKLGTFSLSLKSSAVVNKKDAGVKAMQRVSVNYWPDLDIKKQLSLNNLAFKESKKDEKI